MASRLTLRTPFLLRTVGVRLMSSGEWGSGAGKGGGTGGTVREAGGSFGKREAAQEEQYFRKLQQEQIAKLKAMMEEEMDYHSKEIEVHKAAIERHKGKIKKIKEAQSSDDD